LFNNLAESECAVVLFSLAFCQCCYVSREELRHHLNELREQSCLSQKFMTHPAAEVAAGVGRQSQGCSDSFVGVCLVLDDSNYEDNG